MIYIEVKMDNYSEKHEEQSKESKRVEEYSKFAVKVQQKLLTKKFHQPFTLAATKKFREGQKSYRGITKCKFNARNFIWRKDQEKVPWIR